MSAEAQLPFGHTAWAAPYKSIAPYVLSSSVVAPISYGELAEMAGLDVSEIISAETVFEYAPAGGSPELRERVAAGVLGLIPDNIAVTAGAGEALSMVAKLLCRPEAHVIIGVPAHESIVATARMSGCAVTFVRAPFTADTIIESVRPNTAAVFVSSPHTPTGQVLIASDLARIAAELARSGGLLVVDEVFRGIPLGVTEVPQPVAALVPNGVSIGSLSKVHGLPGLRMGWVAGSTLLVDDVRSLQRWTSRAPATSTEIIATLALQHADTLLARARSLVYDSFAELAAVCDRHSGVRLNVPDGGTTAFPEIDVPDVDAWCNSVAEDFGLLVAPGSVCFGIQGRFRINLGLQPEMRSQAFPILAKALSRAGQLQS